MKMWVLQGSFSEFHLKEARTRAKNPVYMAEPERFTVLCNIRNGYFQLCHNKETKTEADATFSKNVACTLQTDTNGKIYR